MKSVNLLKLLGILMLVLMATLSVLLAVYQHQHHSLDLRPMWFLFPLAGLTAWMAFDAGSKLQS